MATAIVIAMNQTGDVLIGQSSRYLIHHPTFGLTGDEQRVKLTDAANEDAAFNKLLSDIPNVISRHGPAKIKISKESVKKSKDGTYFSGKYRSDLALYPPGLIKGNTNGQNPRVAAQREFKEETGIDLPLKRFKPLACSPNVFLLQLTNQEPKNVFTSWKAMDDRNEGEVFNLRWEPLATLDRTTLNEDSRDALNACFPIPGGRRRQTRRKSVLSRTRRKARRL